MSICIFMTGRFASKKMGESLEKKKRKEKKKGFERSCALWICIRSTRNQTFPICLLPMFLICFPFVKAFFSVRYVSMILKNVSPVRRSSVSCTVHESSTVPMIEGCVSIVVSIGMTLRVCCAHETIACQCQWRLVKDSRTCWSFVSILNEQR